MLDTIKVLLVLALVTLAGCQRQDSSPPPTVQPSTNSRIIELQSANVEEFKLTDGTPCVKSKGMDGGISCGWGYNLEVRRP